MAISRSHRAAVYVRLRNHDQVVERFARQINPVNPLSDKTRFHEPAHVLLGHTAEGELADSDITPQNLRQCDDESVALLCCAALDLPGVAASRSDIQSWWGRGNRSPERLAQRIFKTGDQIFKAGTAQGVRS